MTSESHCSPSPLPLIDGALQGTVTAIQANYAQVQLDLPSTNVWGCEQLLCTRRARLKKVGQRVMVGDRVIVEEPDWEGGRGAIADVLPRQSELKRPPIANVNQVLMMFALAEPVLDPHQLSRFLVMVESEGLAICLCLNKRDLIPISAQEQWQERLASWGYPSLLLSLQTGEGLAPLLAQLRQKITVLAGPSGVGKSSLINALIPSVRQRVNQVSGKLARGRHTTRHIELFSLAETGLLADSPGFNRPEVDYLPEELATYFPEARQRLAVDRCQIKDCLHRDEPNCVVRGDWERYPHYLMMLAEAIAHQTQVNEQGTPETSLKVKTKAKGQSCYEPKLASKKYRRSSRKAEQQNLKKLYHETDFNSR